MAEPSLLWLAEQPKTPFAVVKPRVQTRGKERQCCVLHPEAEESTALQKDRWTR